jgi:hypothetical protein
VSKVVTLPPLTVEEPFPPTIAGLEEARLTCRFMLNRIVQEVIYRALTSELNFANRSFLQIDNITIKPEIATDEKRQPPYLSPFLFKMLLPLGVVIPTEASPAAQAVAVSKIEPDALAQKFMGMAG